MDHEGRRNTRGPHENDGHNRRASSAAPALPPALDSLARFLQAASNFGTEIAFWRSHARLIELRQASAELHSILLSPQVFEMAEPNRTTVLNAFESLLGAVGALKEAVPFRTRVGAIRRSLVPCFQEIFVLHQLTLAVVVRLRLHKTDPDGLPPRAGSLMDLDAKRELAQSLHTAMPFWQKEEWNVYDHL
ncbi:MAG: hypothetical protein U5J83_08605 [Bryobacterales bacterium]|nr:hypothetical protein [Bryobacterales bacterium]